ncbi:MAG: acyl--CoA ligase [Gemmatimonadetes bacterium]|nr:acyl--CoA ligase [Gemmatimonadota bacterium]
MLDRTNLGDLCSREAPEHPAVIDCRDSDRHRVWSTAELEGTANAVARGLLRRYRSGERIAILSANRAEFLAGYFGTMRAGLVTVPINWKLPRDTIEFIFADAEISAVFVDDDRAAMVPAGIPAFRFDGQGPASFAGLLDPGPIAPVVPAAEQLAKILYTSGSTGRPKGVPLRHPGQLWALTKYFTGYSAGREDRTIVVAPTYHKNGLFFSMVAISNQMTIVSLPKFDARSYLEAVARYRCTVLSGIPTMFALIARETDLIARLDLTSVRMVTIGSAPLTDGLVARVKQIFPGATVLNGYGTTEAGPCAFGPHPAGLARPTLALGYPFPDIEWRLVGGPSASEGAFEIRTPALMPGYLNLPGPTAEKVKDGWYATGDVMRHDADGFFYFVGRVDDMFVSGGENIFPGEVEKLLERHPDVAQASIVPVPDEIKGQIPVAFVVARTGSNLTEAELKQYALDRGPAYAHPRFAIFVDAIPVAGTHKVDRRELIERATAHVRSRGRI